MESERRKFGMVLAFAVLFATAFVIVCIGCVSADLNEGLVAYYPFNGNAHDVSGNGNDGTVDDATLTADRFGNQDSAYEFDGKDSRIKLNKNAMDGLDTFTVGLWVKTSDRGYKKTFISASNSDTSNVFLFRHDHGSIHVDLTDRHRWAEYKMSDTKINDGSWHYLAITRSGSMVKLYIDGEFDSEWDSAPAGKIDIEPNGLWLGGEQDEVGGGWDPNQQYKGIMDDIRIYNRALTETEINELYNLYDGGDVATPKKELVGYWNFNEGSEKIAYDSSGYGNDGTIHGATRVNNGGCGKALRFDGKNDYVEILDELDLTEYTIEAWVKPVDVTNAKNIILRTDKYGPLVEVGGVRKPGNWSPQLKIRYDGKFVQYLWDGMGKTVASDTTAVAGTWYHVAGVVTSDGVMRLYVNGVEEGTPVRIGTPWNGGDRYLIGHASWWLVDFFNGTIDEVRIYSYALTQSEIKGDMRNCTPSTPPLVSLAEAVDNTELTWITSGDADWFGQTSTYYYDSDAAQSGAISPNQYSWIQTVVSGPGTLSFYWNVSSEANADFLEFYIDCIKQDSTSGDIDWQEKSYEISLGLHTLMWKYTKDGGTDYGSDCGWLDKVEFSAG